MKFDPSSKPLPREPLPAGSYPFNVISAVDAQSKSGNEMIVVELQVFGQSREVYLSDWLLFKAYHKLLHFCETAGLEQHFMAGEVNAEHCMGTSGTVILEIEEQSGFRPKNKVKDYEGKKPADQVIPRSKKPIVTEFPTEGMSGMVTSSPLPAVTPPRPKTDWKKLMADAEAKQKAGKRGAADEEIPF